MTRKEASKLVLLPVPAGHKIKYQHHYTDPEGVPPKLYATSAWLENEAGERVAVAHSTVNPKDTPIKKLGRAIAHNRCIKEFEKSHA